MVKLGDICSFMNGYAFKSEEFTDNGIPVIKIKNIKHNLINISTADYSKENDKLKGFIVKNNDMVISLTGELSGDVGINTTGQLCYLNQRTARIDVISPHINSRYLYHYFVHSNFVVTVRELARGSAQPNISTKKIEEIKIPLPPIPIQEEIVTNLDRIFANPQDMKETLAFTDRAIDLMLQDPTGAQLEDLVESIHLRRHYQTSAESVKRQMAAVMRSVSARGFERKKLSEICVLNPENISKSEKLSNIHYIDLGSVKEGIISEIQTIPFSEKPDRAQRKVKQFDILWGTVRPLSKSYAFLNTVLENTIVSTGFAVIRKKDSISILPKYMYYMLTTNECVQYLSNKSGGSSYPAFRAEILNEFEIPIPPLPIQTEILAIMNEMDAELKTLEQMSAKAEARARFILDGYLSTPVTEVEEEETTAAPAAASISNVLTHEPAEPDLLPAYESMTRSQLLEECKKRI